MYVHGPCLLINLHFSSDYVMMLLITIVISIIMAIDILSFTVKLLVLVVMCTIILFCVKKLLVRGKKRGDK